MNSSVYLPYRPTIYPGEICGSWLARIKSHNTPGIWNSVLAHLDAYPEIRMRVFDLHRVTESISSVLHYLGTTLHDAIENMSTETFYRAFGSTSPPRRHYVPRFCPRCIEDDIDQYGEPYWHTEHQIFNVVVCRRHAIFLHDRCPDCSKVLGARSVFLVEPITHNCVCGADLREIQQREISTTHPIYALSELSYRALCEKDFSIVYRQFVAFLKKKAGSTKNLQQILQHTWARHPEVNILWNSQRALVSMNASEIAAALVAMGIKYDEAIKEINFSKTDAYRTPREKRCNTIPASLDDARKSMLEFSAQFPQKRGVSEFLCKRGFA